ncbi:MAG: hypothetical protein K6T80_00685 [Firmicutes bacterium]|nr:hypothetical protein [Bacillota bacterium]
MRETGDKKGLTGLAERLKKGFAAALRGTGAHNAYPYYWLSPRVDRGVKRVRLNALLQEADLSGGNSKIFHMRSISKLAALFFPAASSPAGRNRRTPIHLARIEGRYIIEKGRLWVFLAFLLNLARVPVQVVEYDYPSLKRRMQILIQPGGPIVAIAGGQGSSCEYYGLYPAHAETLARLHQVPRVDFSWAGGSKNAAVTERIDRGERRGAGKGHLTVIK